MPNHTIFNERPESQDRALKVIERLGYTIIPRSEAEQKRGSRKNVLFTGELQAFLSNTFMSGVIPDDAKGRTYAKVIFDSVSKGVSARDMSLSLGQSESYINKIENKRKVRVVVTHNNLSLDHYLKDDKPYLISWENTKIDMPIYDLISLYNNHYLDFDFTELLNIYLSKYPLTNEEMILFLVIISIPNKIVKSNSEYQTVLNIRKQLDYIYKTSELVKEYNIKQETDE